MMTSAQIDNWFTNEYQLTGCEVASMMRRNKITIRDLAAKMQITLKRVRQVRNTKDEVALTGHTAIDWIEHITGSLPARARAAYRARMQG